MLVLSNNILSAHLDSVTVDHDKDKRDQDHGRYAHSDDNNDDEGGLSQGVSLHDVLEECEAADPATVTLCVGGVSEDCLTVAGRPGLTVSVPEDTARGADSVQLAVSEDHAEGLGEPHQVRPLSQGDMNHLRIDNLFLLLTALTSRHQQRLHVPHAEEDHLSGLPVHVLHQNLSWDVDGVAVVLPGVGSQ